MYQEIQERSIMPEGRSLLTEREREILQQGRDSEEYSDNRWYNVRHRIRERMDELPEDLEVLEEHYPEVYAQLVELIAEEAARDGRDAEPQPA